MIKIINLSKNYAKIKALHQINLTLPKNTITGLLGPNGAGKSTLMKIITGIIFPNEGTCYVDDEDIRTHPLSIKKKIGFLHELPPLYQEMSVEPYLAFVSELKQITPKIRRRQEIQKVLTFCQLEDKKYLPIKTLSKGYRQRVGLAMSLLGDPPILILDEPYVGIDPNQMFFLRDLIKQQSGKRTVLISSHILSEIEATCDNTILIHQGKVTLEGSIQSIKQSFFEKQTISISLEKSKKSLKTAASSPQKTIPEKQTIPFLPSGHPKKYPRNHRSKPPTSKTKVHQNPRRK